MKKASVARVILVPREYEPFLESEEVCILSVSDRVSTTEKSTMATGPKFVLIAGDEPRLWSVYLGVCAADAERQDSVNLHAEFDDRGCKQKEMQGRQWRLRRVQRRARLWW